MFKKILFPVVLIVSMSCTAQANELIEKAKELSASEVQRLRPTLSMQIISRRANIERNLYSDILDVDFADYSVEELEELMDYTDNINDDIEHIVTVDPYTDFIPSQDRACFLFYSTVQDASCFFEYVTQNHNPEITFDVQTQTVDTLRLYMTYFADCTKEEARQSVELYTDELIYALSDTYQNVYFDSLSISWKIPSINEESLYAASFSCKNEDNSLIRTDGTGLIYQE